MDTTLKPMTSKIDGKDWIETTITLPDGAEIISVSDSRIVFRELQSEQVKAKAEQHATNWMRCPHCGAANDLDHPSDMSPEGGCCYCSRSLLTAPPE